MKLNLFPRDSAHRDFAMRGLWAAAIAAGALVLWRLSDLLPAVFASILIAIGWRGAAEGVAARAGISHNWALLFVAAAFGIIVGSALALFGGQLLSQYDEIALDIPASIQLIERIVEEHPLGRFVEKFVVNFDFSKASAPIAGHVAALLGSLGNAIGFTVFAIIGAAYLAAEPGRYADGVVALAPTSVRADIRRFLDESGAALRQWLQIQLYVVGINAAFAGLGLWAFGVDAPLALATISGALSFIPYFGSIVALAIGALVALPHGASSAGLAALAIGGASFIEGYLITPYLQSRSLMVPPVVLLFFMLAFGVLFGAMGIVLAVPATVVLMCGYRIATEVMSRAP